jgi:NAD(P)H-hydrate epimerase
MIPVLAPAEAAALDAAALERGIAVETLMENAGRELASAAVDVAGGAYGRRAVVVCGKGNNGGDGLVAARHLARRGVGVCVLLLVERETYRGAAAANLARLERTSARVRRFDAGAAARELARADVVIDAVFGTGFAGRVEGAPADAIAAVNERGATVVAADIPSGVDGETGAVDGPAVRADVTVTFGAPKPGVLLPPGSGLAGVLEIADIGIPTDLVRADVGLVTTADVAGWLPARGFDTHKRDAGYAAVIGGSSVMTGAVGLSAGAAYRAGAGLVAVAVPEPILRVVQPVVREAVFAPLPATSSGAIAGGSERLDGILEQVDAVAIGPGMTTDPQTQAFVRDVVRSSRVPVVLDADGLNAFAGRAGELADREGELVLTPHAGEFARLAGVGAGEVVADRIGHVRKLASQTNAVVLLKGSRTLVVSPDGSVRINPTGGPFLATGGTGDVLTGAIAALLARGLEPADAASAAAFVHGVAGSLAADATGEGTVAGDVLARLARAMTEVVEA